MTGRQLWLMARAAWGKTALLASLLAMPEEDAEPLAPDDFNPFLAGERRDRQSAVMDYNPEVLRRMQKSQE